MASLVFDHEDAEEKLLAQALFVNDVDLGDEDDLLVRWSQSKLMFPKKNLSDIPVRLYSAPSEYIQIEWCQNPCGYTKSFYIQANTLNSTILSAITRYFLHFLYIFPKIFWIWGVQIEISKNRVVQLHRLSWVIFNDGAGTSVYLKKSSSHKCS